MEGGDPTMTRLSPAVSLLSKRVLASPVSAPMSAAAPQPSPSFAAVGVTANLPLMGIPEVTIAQPLSMSPPWLRHEMRYQAVMTPPPSVPPEQMITPDPNQTFTHHEGLDPRIVPNYEVHFDTLDEAYEFYRHYAELVGFPIKKNRTRTNGKEICCSFEGKHKSKVEDEHQRDKTSKRGGCKAMVCAKPSKDGSRWYYTRIVLDHNYKLYPSPRWTKRMRAHKVKEPATMDFVDTMHAGRVPHPNFMRILRSLAGGTENLHVTERDIQNRRAAYVREQRMDDIPKLQAFFVECEANNPQFFCEYQVDDKNVVKNVFWSHASQQGDYADYSSVVTFDMTYRTNQYSMPLAMFEGYNNQLQNVVFGQALLRDERADTFEWLFKQFRICMGGQDPIIIFTDKDSSIEKAINLVFEETFHRYCCWHVTNKYRNELNQLNHQHPGLCETLITVVNHPLTPFEFEKSWAAMLDKYEVHESKILMKLFDERRMWIGSYFKEIFCGTVTSTQRSESVNSVVKAGYCDNSTAIHEFAKSFLELLEHIKENEVREGFNSQAPNVPSTWYGFDRQLSRVYSRAVYKEFKCRQKAGTAFFVKPDPNKKDYYLVSHTRAPTDFPWLQHEYWVKAIVDRDVPEESEFNCECMRMEHTGMFCPYLVAVLTNLQVSHIPSRYIPKRYTRDARVDTSFDRHDKMFVGPCGATTASRAIELLPDWCALQRSAVLSSEAVTKCKEMLHQALAIIKDIPHDVGPSAPGNAGQLPEQEQPCISAEAPPISTTKGSRTKVVEGAPEPNFQRPQQPAHKRRCSTCGETGHKATTCGRPRPAKRPRGRPVGSGGGRGRGMRGRGRGRGRGRRSGERSDYNEADSDDSDSEDYMSEYEE